MNTWSPLLFKSVYQSYLWGGRRLPESLGRRDAPAEGPVAESWEISDRADGMSVVADGPFAGRSLRSLVESQRAEIIGASPAGEVFPLLIKLIDARETLSVQVHPDDAAARQGMGEAKSEAWYILRADPGACVYRGLKAGVTVEQAERALTDGSLAGLLERVPVAPGDIIYVPGGTVHAIGAGCLLLEVQQNSNTTYRIFDWNRVGPDGKPRALHLDEARKVTHWQTAATHSPAEGGRCVTPYFTIEPCQVGRHAMSVADPLQGFTILFVEEGTVQLQYGGEKVTAQTSSTWLLPAALRNVKAASASADAARVVLIRGGRGG